MQYVMDWTVLACSLYGLCLLLWQWRKVHHATEVYRCIIVLFFALTVGAGLHVFVASGQLPGLYSQLVPVLLLCAIVPLCYIWTRRAWVFAHSTEKDMQARLSMALCPLLGKYCAPLGAQKNEEERP